MRISLGIVLTFVVLIFALPSGADAQPTFEETDCTFFEPPRNVAVTCGFLTVPESRTDPSSTDTIRLPVVIFHAQSENPAPDPVVYLSGGPGGSALFELAFLYSAFEPFTVDRDLIVFDQRGTGAAEPSLACPNIELYPERDGVTLTDEELLEMELNDIEDCRQNLLNDGVDLANYTSVENAADVNDLRIALGYDEWNILGISYGTRLAQTVMRDFPEGVRSVILDSAYPLEEALYVSLAENAERAFRVLFDNCAADADCSGEFPDLESVFEATYAALEESPASLDLSNPLTGESFTDVVFDGTEFTGTIFQLLYSTEILPLLPEMIYNINAGDYVFLELILGSFLISEDQVALGMNLAVQCNEEVAFIDLDDFVASDNPIIADFASDGLDDATGLLTLCELWGPATPDPIENEAVLSDIPAFIMAGEYDPITPPEWGIQVSQNLANSYYAEYPSHGHGISITGDCPTDMAIAFLNDPTTAPDASCIETSN